MREILKQGAMGENYKLEYSANKVARAVGLPTSGKDRSDSRRQIWRIARNATNILKDLAEVRNTEDLNERAAKFAKILGGEGESGLGYEEILKVFVQMADPMDLSAEFYVRIDKKRKGEKDIDQRFAYNRKMQDAHQVADMSRTRKRFEPPPVLND
jgi:hypothetical protein